MNFQKRPPEWRLLNTPASRLRADGQKSEDFRVYNDHIMDVDKTRNMEHAGTCRNIPEHPGTWKNKNNFHGKEKLKIK